MSKPILVGSYKVARAKSRSVFTMFIRLMTAMLLASGTKSLVAQATTSSVVPASPSYVDAVTGIVTIPASAGLGSGTTMLDYTVDDGPVATATVSTGSNYVNIGQLSIGSHVLHFQAHPSSPSASPIAPPPPVNIAVSDQSFGFVGVYGRFNSNYTDANLFSCAGLAIDSRDTVWIADSILSKLVSFDVFGNINNIAIASLPIPIANPAGLAFDSNDNLFIADHGNSRIIKYTPAGVETVVTVPGLGKPGQLMLDKARNLLYIIDQDNERVVRYDLSGMGLAGYPFSGLTGIQSIALDPAGNVYVADHVAGFLQNVNSAVSALPFNAPLAEFGGIYIDRAGNFYLSDSGRGATFRIDAEGHQTQISDGDSSHGVAEDSRGRIYFGTSTNVRTFTPAGELGTPAATKSIFSNSDQNNSLVYTMPQGQTALTSVVSPSPTFHYDVGTEACPFVEIFGTCYFQVNFAPQVPGVHTGNVATTLPGGPTISTLLYGTATGPAPAFSPGTQTQTPSGAVLSENVTLDQAGNYYVSDATGNQVYETSGGVTRSLGFTGLSFPNSLAVDGAGAVYVQDLNNRITKLDVAGNQTFPVVAGTGNALSSLDCFAMDGGGQIYFAGPAGGGTSIYLYDRTGATSLVASGLVESASLALDPYGDIYSLRVDGSLLRIGTYGKQSLVAPAETFHNHTALAVDASETAYVAQGGVAAITLLHPDGTTESIPVPTINYVGGIAIDGTGSILAVDAATNNFTFIDRTHQDFNFGNVPVNTMTTFAASFGNAGSQTFNINGLPGDNDFKQVTTSDACSTTGTNSNVAAGSSCDLSYTVDPTSLGTITASSRITTNASVDYDTFTLNAARVPAAPAFTPSSLNFGNVTVGQTATQVLSLTNKDTAPLTLGNISLLSSYSLTSASTCKQNGTIAVGGSCSFTLQFAPTVAGEAPSTLSVQYTGGTATANIAGTGVVAPIATLAPTSLNFGNITVGGTSGVQSALLTNIGTAQFLVASITPSDPSIIVHSSFCARPVTPTNYCKLEVTVAPTAMGAFTGSVVIDYSLGTGSDPSQNFSSTLTITATGIAPAVTLTPASADFGSIAGGQTSPPQTFTLTNNYTTAVSLSQITIGGPFQITAGATCIYDAQLPAGQSCTIPVAFVPVASGATTGTLYVSYLGAPGGAVTKTALFTGTGTGSFAKATLTPASYDFGNVTVGATSSQLLLKFTNTGTTTLHPGNATGTLAGVHFPATGATTCTGGSGTTVVALSPGQSCNLAIDFAPTTTGTQTGNVTIPSEAGNTSATITGAGVAPTATLTPVTYNFGSVTLTGTSSQLLLKLTNTSNVSLHTTGSLISSSAFVLLTTATNCTDTTVLAPGGFCNLAVDFSPTAVGTVTGTISIGSEAGTETATLTGTGTAPTATITPASYNFGDITVGTLSSPIVLKFTNTSTIPLHPMNASGTVAGVQFLSTAATTCTGGSGSTVVTLSPGASCNLAIEFAPTAAGTVTGVISIPSEAGTTSASITGTGVAPPLPPTLTPSSLSFGNVTADATSAAQTVTFTNPGSFPLSLTSIGLVGSGFSIQAAATTCKAGPSIAAGTSCTLSIIFSPATAGAVSGTLTINLPTGLAVSSLSIPLTGTGVAAVVSPESIDFTGGFTPSGLTLNGAATVSSGVLQLTSNQPSQAGTAFYPTPVSTASFSTDFAFQLLDPLAEGITFTIQGNGPTAIGSNDGGLGYQGITKSIALKFDLRDTAGEGVDSTGIYVDGAPPTIPATSLAASGIDLHSGDVFALHVSYDGTTESITLMDTVTGAMWSTQAVENIPSIVGSGQAYFGFTASTGAASTTSASDESAKPAAAAASVSVETTANILYWTYSSQSDGVAALEPIELNFGNITAGSTSGVQSALLTNTSTAQFQVTSITPSDPSIVLHSSFCARPVTPGNYCKVEVTVAPTATGAFTGSVAINYHTGDGSTPAQNFTSTLKITATGIASPITLTPATSDFGGVAATVVGPPKMFTVTNGSSTEITLLQVTIGGEFQFTPGGTCYSGATLAPGKTCMAYIAFAPLSQGAMTGALNVSYIANARAVKLTSSFTGTGLPPLSATLTPDSGFFNVTVGQSQSDTFILTNTGNAPIHISSVQLTGESDFSVASQTCGTTLAAGNACDFVVAFSPRAVEGQAGAIVVQTDAGTKVSGLTGYGNAPPPPMATLTPGSYQFLNVQVGQSQTTTFVLTNTGTALLHITSVGLTGGSDFSIVGKTCGTTLAIANACTINVAFTPLAAEAQGGDLVLQTDAGVQSSEVIAYGVLPPPPTATLTPGSYQFLSVQVGQSQTTTFVLTNTSTALLDITSIGLTGGSDFSITGETCGNTLASGNACSINVAFTPLALEAQGGDLVLQTDAGVQSSELIAYGVAPPATTPFINFGTGFTTSALTLSGPATVTNGALQITSGPSAAASSAFYPTQVPTASFNTNFTFQLLDPAAEGITFTIQNDGLNAVGAGGGGLGYQGIRNSLAVKFDLKDTAGEGIDSSGIYIGGAAPTVPAISLASAGIDLHSGDVFNFQLSYDGTMLTAILTDTKTKATWTTTIPEDIPGILNSNMAYFGFTAGSGTSNLTADVASPEDLAPRASTAASSAESTTSKILKWTYVAGSKVGRAQTISFSIPAQKIYGAAPFTLSATASSGLPINYSVQGPAKLSGSTLTITGAGVVTVTASQPGDATYAPAPPVKQMFTVARASLTVTANSLSRAAGAANPVLTYVVTGFLNRDTMTVVSGTATLTTSAVLTSPPGSYPITFANKALAAANYSFEYTPGTLTVSSGTLVISPSAGNFGSVEVGTTSPIISFTVINDTTSTMGYLGYTNLGEFYLQPGTCHLVNGEPMLKPGQGCAFTAVFKPTKIGAVSGNLSIQTSSGTFNIP